MRIVWSILFIASIFIVWFFLSLPGHAHFAERPDLNGWFDSLKSPNGLCCSFADGLSLSDVDWDTRDDGHYTVKIAAESVTGYRGEKYPKKDEWVLVPDAAVITQPNKFGPAIVWPYWSDATNEIKIRCFIPGAGS